MNTRQKLIVVACLMTATLLSATCSKKPSGPPDNTGPITFDYLRSVTLTPESGPPGTPVLMQGLTDLPDDAEWNIYIGSTPAMLMFRDSESYMTAIPLIYSASDSTWPAMPAEPVSVVLYRDGIPVDSIPAALTIESLPRATDTVDSIIQNLTAGISALRAVAGWNTPVDSQFQVILSAMDEILVTGDNSLTAFLDGRAPLLNCDSVPLELISAVCQSSGLNEVISQWADKIKELSTALNTGETGYRMSASAVSNADYNAEYLAFKMQLQSLLKEFGTTFVGQTNSTWGEATTILGLIGIASPLPPIAQAIIEISSFILNVADFVINKVLVGVLPARLTALELDFQDHIVANGDSTWSIIYISAKNEPTEIGVQDIISQVLNVASFTNWATSNNIPRSLMTDQELIDDIIEGLTTWILGVIRSVQGAMGLPDLTERIPDITWDSVRVYEPGLMELVSFESDLFTPLNNSLNWLASNSNTGYGHLQVRTAVTNGWIHPTLAELGYSGGSFGDETMNSNVDTVQVMPELYLSLNFPSSIDSGGSASLIITAGIKQGGSVNYTSGIAISITVSGGNASPSSGSTDGGGNFLATVNQVGDANEVVVTVTASAMGGYAYKQARAAVGGVLQGCIGKMMRFTTENNVTYYIKYRNTYSDGFPVPGMAHVGLSAVYKVHDSTKWWSHSTMWPWMYSDIPWTGDGFIYHYDKEEFDYSYYAYCYDVEVIYTPHPDTCGCVVTRWEREFIPANEFPWGPCE